MRIAAAVALALTAIGAHGAELVQRPNPVQGRYIVVLNDDTSPAVRALDAASLHQRRIGTAQELVARHGGRTEHVYERALNGFVATMTDAQVRAALSDPRVRFIQQDAVVKVNPIRANGVQDKPTWGLDRIDQRNLPLDAKFAYATSGKGVNAYIIDTGILASHSEFTGRIGAGFTSVKDGKGTNDCEGHGSHVAGTVGGRTYGVAKDVTLYPVRVLGCDGSGTDAGVIAGVDWVTANHSKPAVANMSLGGGLSTALDTAVRNSIAAGVTYAIASGNENEDGCLSSPSRVSQAITVGATGSNDARASFSNFGSCLDIFAPGVNITSVGIATNTATDILSGTSMATPHVAGAAALYLEANPKATPADVAQGLLAAATPGKVTSAGTGSPNRLLFVGSDKPPVDAAPVAAFKSSCTARTCTFDASSSTDDQGLAAFDWQFGDGTRSSGRVVTKTYASNGTFQVTLGVTDTAGQGDTETASVTISATDPGAPCTACTQYGGSIASSKTSSIEPAGVSFTAAAGTHRGWLQGPASGTDFDLYLEQFSGGKWKTVAKSTSSKSSETVTYNGAAGQYRWRVYAYRGTGAYKFWLQRP